MTNAESLEMSAVITCTTKEICNIHLFILAHTVCSHGEAIDVLNNSFLVVIEKVNVQ